MQAKSDAQLLQEYTRYASEPAFSELVQRHAGLVYSAALRQIGSPDRAQEIAQSVFIDLARKAQSLASDLRVDSTLTGWLYRATRFAALNMLRNERRQSALHYELMRELQPGFESPLEWERVAPLLDEALSTLSDQERDALLMRYFKNQDFRSVGAALGVSDDTAQKRVSRSLEKLRAALLKRGITTTPAALSAALAAHAVQAVPAGLPAAWSAAALATAPLAAKSGATLSLLKIMSMTKIQLGTGALIVAGLAATVGVQYQSQNRLQQENQDLHQHITRLTADFETLSNRVAQAPASAPASAPNDQFRELLRLRGEVGRLRELTNQMAAARAQNLRVQASMANQEAENANFVGHSASIVNAAKQIGVAFRIYSNDNEQFPTNLASIHNELAGATNFSGNVALDSFEMVNVGKAGDRYPQAVCMRERDARQAPDGSWERIYLYCDGSVQVVRQPDGNFDQWEAQTSANVFPDPQQP